MLRIGIVGAGGMGHTHARHLNNVPDVSLLVFDIDEAKRRDLGLKWNAVACASLEELLANCDVCDVCLPNFLHAEIGLKAIAERRAVFMEKPLAHTLEDGRKLKEAVAKAGTPFMVGHVVRYFREYAAANRLVKQGAVGKPAAIRMRRGGGPPGRGVPDTWFLDHSLSGGILVDLAVHDFDWLRWTFGEVSSVTARSLGAKTGRGPDYALTTLEFDSGAIAHVESTWVDPGGFRTTFEVCGSEGMIEHDSSRTAAFRIKRGDGTFTENPLAAEDDPFFQELSAFVMAIKEGTPVPVGVDEGFRSLAVATSALESAKTEKSVVPPRD